MARIGKRLKNAYQGIDRDGFLPLEDALRLIKSKATAKFDETIEVAMNLGIDPRHADQMVRGMVTLPTSSAPTIWPRRSRPARSTSTVASPPRT
jgi:large subunit ribosomal protein L1